MKKSLLLIILLYISFIGYAQNLIGYNNKEIINYMKENQKDMNFNTVVNDKYNYLKYSDNSDNQTILFFMNEDSVCHSIRMICDHAIKNQKIKEFNSKYARSGDNTWVDKRKNKDYLIMIKDEPWSCIVSIEAIK